MNDFPDVFRGIVPVFGEKVSFRISAVISCLFDLVKSVFKVEFLIQNYMNSYCSFVFYLALIVLKVSPLYYSIYLGKLSNLQFTS